MSRVSSSRGSALVAVSVALVGATGCGNGDVPADAVAVVGAHSITKKAFGEAALRSPVRGMGSRAAATYDPPGFTQCVAAQQANRPALTPEQEVPESELKRRCKTEFGQIKQEVMQRLIYTEWLNQEVKRQRLQLSDSVVEREVDRYLNGRSAAGQKELYSRLLQSDGKDAVIKQIRFKLERERLLAKVKTGAKPVTKNDIRTYYQAHSKRLVEKQRRSIRVILAPSVRIADTAREVLEAGKPWRAVANRYSVDPMSKSRGGRMQIARGGRNDPDLEQAVFNAGQGALEGPVKSQFGWYIFRVERVAGGELATLDDSRATIKAAIHRQRLRRAVDDFDDAMSARYQPLTRCSAEFVVGLCSDR